MADFLFPDVFNNNFKLLKQSASRDVLARKFTALMPLHITKRLIKNSFAEAFGGDQPMELPQLLTLLDAQFADSSIDPGSDPARWALVNSVTALALRFKTAPGSEADMSVISSAFYQNATIVIPDLILQTPNLMSMQALVSIAMFAKGIPDTTALSALATNVSLQLELLSQKRPSADELNDTERQAERLALCNISVIMRRLATQVSL
ncbi:putative Transcription factor domain-containing protein [Seiridium unicorne]|uniref:Transcription factor domain-containing protein n=1 Tax=Seiridium unicorne TaxID=138068 RepID=A0ABR2UPG2_9PEZI